MSFMQGNSSGQDGITTTHSLGTNFRNDFSKGKGSFYGSYSYANRNNEGFRDISQQNIFQDDIFVNNQNTTFNNRSQNHRAYLNLEYNIDSFNYIKVSPQFSYGKQNNQSISDFSYENKGIVTTQGYNSDTINSTTPTFSANILYNHRFHRRGRNLSITANLGGSSSESGDDKINYTDNQNGLNTKTLLHQLINQNNENSNFGIRINYSEPIARDRFLDLIYSYSRSYSKNDKNTYTIDSAGTEIYNPFLSNAFENTFLNQRAGLNVRTLRKKYNYTLGISFQPVSLDGYSISKDSLYTPQKRLNIFPVARFAYNFTRTKTLNFNYMGNARSQAFRSCNPCGISLIHSIKHRVIQT